MIGLGLDGKELLWGRCLRLCKVGTGLSMSVALEVKFWMVESVISGVG